MDKTQDNDFLLDHRRAHTNALEDLKFLRAYLDKFGLVELSEKVSGVIHRAENDFFSIAIVGEFKRGKSTLINALLGKNILPSDVIPCSATLNRVTYGLKPSVKIVYKAKNGEKENYENIPIDKLADYVTKLTPESETKAADIKEAVVQYPTRYCKDKADIIDTPGLNDDDAMTEVTLSVMNKVDVAILVIIAQSPFSAYEADFLNNRILKSDLGRVMFVVNRIDELRTQQERDRVISLIESRINKAVEQRASDWYGKDTEEYKEFIKRLGKPVIYGISAAQALDAKTKGDDDLLKASGFADFENKLDRFMIQERGVVSLQVMVDCAITSSTQLLHQISIRDGALRMKQDEFEEAYSTTSAKLRDLQSRHQKEKLAIVQSRDVTLKRLQEMFELIPAEMERNIKLTIAEYSVTPQQINQDTKNLQKKIMDKVQDASRNAAQRATEKMYIELEKAISNELARFGEIASDIQATLDDINIQFLEVQADPNAKRNATAEGAMAAVPIVSGLLFSNLAFGLGGMWAGYRRAGAKGAVVGGMAGAVTGVGAIYGAATIAAALSLPVTLPVILAVGLIGGVASVFGGDWATKSIFSKDRVESFKASISDAILKQVRSEFDKNREEYKNTLKQQVYDAFSAVEHFVEKELGAPIRQTQATLDDLQSQRVHSAATADVDKRTTQEATIDIKLIQTKAREQYLRLHELAN